MIWASGLEGASQEVKVREVIKIIEADGWYWLKMEGDHRQFKHQTKKDRVTIAGHPSKEVPPGTLMSIFKQAQLARRK
jgi:predicted RNA binding protein YcfA (HicA-like mRNA interferase family)